MLKKSWGHEKQGNIAENCIYLHNQIGVGVVVEKGGCNKMNLRWFTVHMRRIPKKFSILLYVMRNN